MDLILAQLVAIATALSPGVLSWKLDSDARDTFETVWRAVRQKYFRAADCRKPKNVRAIARKLAIDILANKPKLTRYDLQLAALLMDKIFVEQLARGFERGRKPIFAKDEWLLLLNWHEWSFPLFSGLKEQNIPPLKFWTREAICKLIEGDSDEVFELSRLDSRLRRLALDEQSAKPAKVIFYEYDGAHRIETA